MRKNQKDKSVVANGLSKRTKVQLVIIAILIIANISAIYIMTRPKTDYSYTGVYSSKVYDKNNKRVKSEESNYILVLNSDNTASLVINGEATNGKWKLKNGKLTVEDKELTEGLSSKGKKSSSKGTKIFTYKDKENNRNVTFTVKNEAAEEDGSSESWEE